MSQDPRPEAHSMAPLDAALELGTSLRIQDVEAGHRLLERTLKGPAPIRIDLSRLVDIDTAGVQLLIAYYREATRLGIDVHFMSEATALTEALRLLGLSGALAKRTGS
jgi:anti-anti-sigma regulatory factor